MKITGISVGQICVPLKTPFITALRRVDAARSVLVRLETDAGLFSYGEAPPTAVITGDTMESISAAALHHIGPRLTGLDAADTEAISMAISGALERNSSAKAAVDMAAFDLLGKLYNVPLYKLLGGYRRELKTDVTISLNAPDIMAEHVARAREDGFDLFKLKLGGDGLDFQRVKAARLAAGEGAALRLDANQSWTAKGAVRLIRLIEEAGLNAELVEQPVPADDLNGLKFVTDSVTTPILADEAVFSPADALEIINRRAADMINIKLMKCGGIGGALRICALAEAAGVTCAMGCMLESQLAVTAAAHVACGKSVITAVDLDTPFLCAENPYPCAASFDGGYIVLSDSVPGLGFGDLDFIDWQCH